MWFKILRFLLGPSDAASKALYATASSGDLRAVEKLLRRRADPNAYRNDNGSTPLMAACADGHVDVVRLLISKGANVNAKNCFGSTPLHSGAYASNLPIILLLVERGADPNAKEKFGDTPLMTAVERMSSITVLDALLTHGAQINERNSKGETAFDLAAVIEDTKALAYLLRKGAEGSKKMLDSALLAAVSNDCAQLAGTLLAKGAIPNARYSKDDFSIWAGKSALQIAREIQSDEMISVLLGTKGARLS